MIERALGVGIVLICLVPGLARGAEAPSPALSDAEYADLVALLDDTQGRLMGLVTGMTDEQWTWKQNPDRWSVGECVEHIARAEKELLGRIQKTVASPIDPDWFAKTEGKLAMVRQYVPNRGPQGQGGVRAPYELEPSEHWSRSRGIQELYRAHGEVRSLVETMGRDVKDRTMESTPPFGWMNAHDWLNLLVLHVVRHTKQIAEVQADPGYPKRPVLTSVADPDPNVTDEELAELVKVIDDAQDQLVGHISGITDEQWSFKQNPNRWSIAECVEHIARTERAILGGIAFHLSRPANPDWFAQTQGKLDLVRRVVVDRPKGGVGSPFQAGGEVLPSEHWDRARGIREFYASHGELRAFVETMPREIKNRTFENPFPSIGMLNGYDWLNLGALHVVRHTLQAIEVQEDPNYPGGAIVKTGG
jgi:uncharacterized damage-inducible protein DinB